VTFHLQETTELKSMEFFRVVGFHFLLHLMLVAEKSHKEKMMELDRERAMQAQLHWVLLSHWLSLDFYFMELWLTPDSVRDLSQITAFTIQSQAMKWKRHH
jgi:hypothetical protein